MPASNDSVTPQTPPRGTLLRLAGRDALAVLHRISTQHLEQLAAGETRSTLFCDFRGRLLHRAIVTVTGDGAVWLLRPDAPGDELAAFLDRHVFREDVRIEDLSATVTIVAHHDERAVVTATGALVELGGRPSEVPVSAHEVLAALPPGLDLPPPRAELLRVRAFAPRHGHEIHADFHPFEVGLAHEVHLQKGCFTGQEALMRLVTYDSVRRRLVRLAGAGAPPAHRAQVRQDGEPVGVVTSAAPDEADGFVALAVVRRAAAEAGAALGIEGVECPAEMVAAPLARPLGVA